MVKTVTWYFPRTIIWSEWIRQRLNRSPTLTVSDQCFVWTRGSPPNQTKRTPCLFKKNDHFTTHSTLSGHLWPPLSKYQREEGLKWPLYFFYYDNVYHIVKSNLFYFLLQYLRAFLPLLCFNWQDIATRFFYIMYLCINNKLKTNIPVLLVKKFSYIVYIAFFILKVQWIRSVLRFIFRTIL